MTELILIRHGETQWNRERRFLGQVDVPLNPMGQEQSRRLGRRLALESIDHMVSSDLIRAQQTADLLGQSRLAARRLPTQLDANLREQNFGVVDGMRSDDIKFQHPQAWENWIKFEADYAFSQGESLRQLHARVMRTIYALATQHRQQTLVVVTHGGVLDMIYRTALGLDLSGPRQTDIPNAGLNRIRIQDQAIEIVCWADTHHLLDLPEQPSYRQSRQ